MGTMFGRLHHALEDKTVGSVNADIGAESCAVGQDHLSSFTEISYLLLYCKRFFFWSAIRSQIILKFSFAFRYRNAFFFSVLFRFQYTSSPKCSYGLAVNSFDGLQGYAIQESMCCAWLSICCRWCFLITRILMNKTLSSAIFSSPSK